MHMTLEADYAVRIVELLTRLGDKTDARTISERTQIPQRFCLKILHRLVTDGIVRSYKGAKGGYQLAKPAQEITLREVIESVEGPYMLNRCQSSAYTCTHKDCRFHTIYREISDLVRQKLDSYTFAAICGENGCTCHTDPEEENE